MKAAKKDAGKLKSEDDFNDWMADKGYPIMLKYHKPGPFHKGKKPDFVKDSDSDLFDRYRKDIVKGLRLKLESISEALGNDNPSHREKPKMDKDGTVHNIPGKKGGLSAYSIKPRLDGKTLKFGTVDNEGNIKVMTVQELAKVLK